MMSEQTTPDCATQNDQGPTDRAAYARAADVKVGDVMITDGGFTCMPAGAEKIVQADEESELCIPCDHGLHKLEGQLGYTDETEGLYVGLMMKPTGRRIYVASSWRNAHQPEVVARLRSAGHEVYDFRNPAPGNTGFAWSAIDPDWLEWSPDRFVELVTTHQVAGDGFGFDKRALDWCDTCVLVLPCGRSAHLEAGYAAGQGKTVLFLLHEDRFEPELMYLLGSGFACSIDELIAHPRLTEPQAKDGGTAAVVPAELRQLSNRATPGPWTFDDVSGFVIGGCDPGKGLEDEVPEDWEPVENEGDDPYPSAKLSAQLEGRSGDLDFEFMIAAANDVRSRLATAADSKGM